MGTKQRILSYAYDIFLQRGVRSITIDQIARDLGISKKTVYLHFDKKADIVHDVCQIFVEEDQKCCEEISQTAIDAVDELVRLIRRMINIFQKISPQIIYEIRKYYPDAWNVIEKEISVFFLDKVIKNLERGIQEEYYRPEIDVDIVSRMRIGSIQMGFDPVSFPPDQYNYGKVQVQLFEVYMYGIVADKGRELLEKYMNQEHHSAQTYQP